MADEKQTWSDAAVNGFWAIWDWLLATFNATNAFLAPWAQNVEGLKSAPVFVLALFVWGVWKFLVADPGKKRKDAEKERKAAAETAQLRQDVAEMKQRGALIERALAAIADKAAAQSAGGGPQPAGADALENLRRALTDFTQSADPRGAQVPVLVEQRRTEEAQQVASAIAADAETHAAEIGAAHAEARAKAAKAWADAGAIAYLNDPKAALAAYQKARGLGDESFNTLIEIGILSWRLGALAEAEAAYRAAEAGLGADEQASRAAILGNLGVVAWTRGDLAAAEDYHRRALSLFEAQGDKEGMAGALGNLGLLARARGDLAAAEDYHKRALALDEALGSKEGMAAQLGNSRERGGNPRGSRRG